MTTWIQIDELLNYFGLTREDIIKNAECEAKILSSIRHVAEKLPTYVTIKEVKKRWGRGQEDIYPVAQFERLWGDMTALEEVSSAWFEVPRQRGQQLKEVGQLDAWLRDGSAAAIEKMLG